MDNAGKGNGNTADRFRVPVKKYSQKSMVEHGLCADPSRWDLDGRTLLAKQLTAFRTGLEALFRQGPDHAEKLLIDRVVYKAVKLALYEATDLFGEDGVSPAAEQRYLQMTNSFREDLRLLKAMARDQAPARDPDLQEYLETLRRAARAQVVKVS